jgi:hypothetical protein
MNSLKTIEKIAFRKKMNPYHITKKIMKAIGSG